VPKTPDLHSINPDGTKTDTWIFEELLGADDVPDAAYRHIVPTEPPTSLYRDKLKALQLDWDEGEHPRADDGKFTDGSGGEYATSPDAPRGGDGQQALFEYAPESGSEQALRVDAKAGVKEVEKLLEAAVDDADYDLKVEAWDEVDSDDQNAVEEHFIDSGIGDSGAVEAGQQATDDYVNEHLNDADVHERVMEEGFASDFSA
jgi:hypothetical protein